jgi:hypothetical protein
LLITRKRSAQAEGSGVKERSSRTQGLSLAPLLDGAQRLEGRRTNSHRGAWDTYPPLVPHRGYVSALDPSKLGPHSGHKIKVHDFQSLRHSKSKGKIKGCRS